MNALYVPCFFCEHPIIACEDEVQPTCADGAACLARFEMKCAKPSVPSPISTKPEMLGYAIEWREGDSWRLHKIVKDPLDAQAETGRVGKPHVRIRPIRAEEPETAQESHKE